MVVVEAIRKSHNKVLSIVTSFSACSASKTISQGSDPGPIQADGSSSINEMKNSTDTS